jgi:geranylgeranylglycerol-phosphate geranylgeranyltransferase
MINYLKLIRPLNCLIAGIAVIISIFIASGSLSLNTINLLAFAAVFMVTAAGNSINDYFDFGVDKINNPDKPIPSEKIVRKRVLYFSILLFLLGITISYFINPYVFLLVVFNVFVLSLYSKIKENTPFGSLIIAYLVFSVFLFGGLVTNSIGLVVILGALAALATIAREITKDIEDVKGDKYKKTTLVTNYGERKAGIIAAFVLLIAIFLSPLPYSKLGQTYLYVVFVADVIFAYCGFRLIYNPKKHAGDVQRLEKLGMFVGLIAFLVGIY